MADEHCEQREFANLSHGNAFDRDREPEVNNLPTFQDDRHVNAITRIGSVSRRRDDLVTAFGTCQIGCICTRKLEADAVECVATEFAWKVTVSQFSGKLPWLSLAST